MKIAVVQMDIFLGQPERNLSRMLERYREARAAGAELVMFPECALTGYCFNSLEEARPFAEVLPGPSTRAFQNVISEIGGVALFGLIEQQGESFYNSAALVSGTGMVAAYRKIHLPGLGFDRFATPGQEPFAVYDVGDVRVGIGICYDSAFPEAIRTLSLMGADLIVLPTNFPTGAECMTDYVIRTRALENKVYFACCNRVGEEQGFRFIGDSQICNVTGDRLTMARGTEETILYATIDPASARDKRVPRKPTGGIERFADRRPEMYGELVKPRD